MSYAPPVRGRFAVLVVSLLLVCPAASNAAERDDSPTFLGTWQGIDPLDGGLITPEITRHPGEPDVLDLRFSDTFIRACTLEPIRNLPSGESVDGRRGIYLGFAWAWGGNLVSTGSVPGAGRMTGGVQDVRGGPSLSPAGAYIVEVPIFSFRSSAPDRPFMVGAGFWRFWKTGDVVMMTGTLCTDDPGTAEVETGDGPNSVRFRRISVAE